MNVQANSQLTEKQVFRLLEQLERSVYVPLVSGEAARWLESVTAAAQAAQSTICEYYRQVHSQLFKQMAELDPEQFPRFQKLEEEDEAICASLQETVELATKLNTAADLAELDERLLSKATKELADRVIAVVLRARKHETEISTWHVEALVRDRGAVD
jgi:hypothetical protein